MADLRSQSWTAGLLLMSSVALFAQDEAATVVPAAGEGASPERSVSASGQFRVFGNTPQVRGAFCVTADELSAGLARALKTEDRWRHTVVIQLHSDPPANQPNRFVAGRIMPTQGGIRFQLDVLLLDGFTLEAMERELMRLLIFERMFRDQSTAAVKDREGRILPHWLQFGMAGLVRYERNGFPEQLFAGLLAENRILDLEGILEGDPRVMNSVSRAVFEASSAAFVKTLLELESGSQRLAKLIEHLPGHDGQVRDLLLNLYPSLTGSSNSLEKWWALEIATMGRKTATDFLNPEETGAQLERNLYVRIPADPEKSDGSSAAEGEPPAEVERVRISDYGVLLKLKKDRRRALLAQNDVELLRLGYEGHPLYRSIIGEYREILGRIAEGKRLGLGKRVEAADARAARLHQRMQDIEDYLNWFEATQIVEKSGAFEDYKQAVDQLRKDAPRRDDAISRALDRAEAEDLPEPKEAAPAPEAETAGR